MTVTSFLSGVKARGGLKVLSSGLFAKVLTIFVTILAARLISKENFGELSFVIMTISPLIPLACLGVDFTYLQKAVNLSKVKQEALLLSLLKVGVLSVTCFYLLILAGLYAINVEPLRLILFSIFSLILLTDFLLRILQNHARVTNNNSYYAVSVSVRGVSLLILTFLFIFEFGVFGYAFSLLVAPLFAALYLLRKINLEKKLTKSFEFDLLGYVKFGLLTAIGAVASQAMIPLAGVILGVTSDNEILVANYRVASIIPLTLMILPQLFFKSEFVHLVENSLNREIIKTYVYNYSKLISLVCVVFVVAAIFFGEQTIILLFGEKYRDAYSSFVYMVIALVGALTLRQLFGNLNYAAGRSDLNVYSAFFSLGCAVPLVYFGIITFPEDGAAIGVMISIWFSGFLNALIYYLFVYRKLD